MASGILAQPVVCKHTDKIKMSEHPSVMMSGGSSLRMSVRISMMMSGGPWLMKSRRLSVMVSKHLSMMMSGGSSPRMSVRISMMMSEHPSMMKFIHPSVKMYGWLRMMTKRPSSMMSGRLSVMMSDHLLISKFGCSSLIFVQPSMGISGRPSVKVSGCPSTRMSGRLSTRISQHPLLSMSKRRSTRIPQRSWPTKKASKSLSMKMSKRASMKMSVRPSLKKSRRPSVRICGLLSMRMSGCSLMRMSLSPLRIMSGHNNQELKKTPDNKGHFENGTRCKQEFWDAKDSSFEKPENKDFNAVTVNKTSPPKKYTGLQNQGATCYLNTVLQILFMTKKFREAAEKYLTNDSSINNQIAQLFEQLKSGKKSVATTEGITAELKINVHKEEDAAKCLQKILNKIDPEISKIFKGEKVDTTVCKNPAKDHEPLKQKKSFFIISISLESQPNIDLQSCFDSYFKPIVMSGEDQQIYCKYCQVLMDTEMICSLTKLPPVLVLQLERFELDYDAMCYVKNDSSVQIPAQLKVKCLQEEADKNSHHKYNSEAAENIHMYDLYAIANHVGSLSGGHYYADIKSFENNQWYQFNDSSVHMIPQKFDLNNHISSEEAFLLLYKKSAVSTAPENGCHSQTKTDNQNTEKEISCDNVNLANDELNTNDIPVQVPVQSQFNVRPHADITSTSSDETMSATSDTPSYSQTKTDNQNTEKEISCDNVNLANDERNTNNIPVQVPVQSQFNCRPHADITSTSSDETMSATSDTPSHPQTNLDNQNMMEKRMTCKSEKTKTYTNSIKDPEKSQVNFNLKEQKAYYTNTLSDETNSGALETTCDSQTISDNQNAMEEIISCESENRDEDEMNTDNIQDPVESHQQSDLTNTVAFHRYLDVPESAKSDPPLLQNLLEHSDETNASTQLMSHEVCIFVMDTVPKDDDKISYFENVKIRFRIVLFLCTVFLAFFIFLYAEFMK